MRVKGGVREAFSFVLAEKSTVAQSDMIDFVAGALPVQSVPLFVGRLSLSARQEARERRVSYGLKFNYVLRILLHSLSARGMQQKRHERRSARAEAVICQKRVLEFVFANNMLCGDVESEMEEALIKSSDMAKRGRNFAHPRKRRVFCFPV